MATKIQKQIQYPGSDDVYIMYDGGAVRFDEDQALTEAQKEKVRANIGAVAPTDDQKAKLTVFKEKLADALKLALYEDPEDDTNPGKVAADAAITALADYITSL